MLQNPDCQPLVTKTIWFCRRFSAALLLVLLLWIFFPSPTTHNQTCRDLGHRRKKKICSIFLWGNALGWDEGITGIRPKLGISMWGNAIRWRHYQNWLRTRPTPHVGPPSNNALNWGYYLTLLYLPGMVFKFGNALACNQGLRTVCLGLGEVCSRMVVNLNLQWARNWCKHIIPMRYCEKLWTSDKPCVSHFAQLIETGIWRWMRV